MKYSINKTLRFLTLPILVSLFLTNSAFSVDPVGSKKAVITKKDSLESLKSLAQELDIILSDSRLAGSKVSACVYSLDRDEIIYEKNSNTPLTPASNEKIVTSYSAFKLLGTDYFLETLVFSDDPDITDSIVNGSLYVKSYGDALFTLSDMDDLVTNLQKLGIKRVTGGVFADGSFFDGLSDRLVYSGDDDVVEPLPPITALCLEENVVIVLVTSGSRSGSRLAAQTIPASDALTTSVSAVVKRNNVRRSLRFSQETLENGTQKYYVKGYLNPNRSYSYRFHAKNPELIFAGALKHRLAENGIEVLGEIGLRSIDSLPEGKRPTFLTWKRRPLAEMVETLNKESDNRLAETLFKILGASAQKDSLDAASARNQHLEYFCELDSGAVVCKFYDGSGLSRRNLVTSSLIVNILDDAWNSDFKEAFDASLAIAGTDGTLEKRMRNTVAEGNLRAKTGTLRNVSALSGYVKTLDGENLAFSFIFNGYNVGSYKEIENRLGETLARFFYFNAEY